MGRRLPFACALLFLAACACYGQDAKALVDAGQAKLEEDDWKGAIEDFTRAIEIDPANPLAYKGRAFGRQMLLDFDGAIEDLDRAVALDPQFKMAWNNRANARRCREDYAGCIADCDRAIELDPKFDFPYLSRAYAKILLDDLDGAAADFLRAFELETEVRDYPNFWLWVIRARGGKRAEADAALLAHLTERAKPDDWVAKVGAFLLGQAGEDALFQEAEAGTDGDERARRCEAFYYAGLVRSLSGDLQGAAGLYQQSLDTGKTDFIEYHASKVALAALSRSGK